MVLFVTDGCPQITEGTIRSGVLATRPFGSFQNWKVEVASFSSGPDLLCHSISNEIKPPCDEK